MPSIDSSMTVGVFRDREPAQQALTTLRSAGFDQIQFLEPGHATPQSGGLFSSIKRLFTSDNSEGIAGNLTDTGISEADARYYQQEHEAGRIIITVRANERKQEALDILRRYGAYDAFTRNLEHPPTGTVPTTTAETSPSETEATAPDPEATSSEAKPAATAPDAEATSTPDTPSSETMTAAAVPDPEATSTPQASPSETTAAEPGTATVSEVASASTPRAASTSEQDGDDEENSALLTPPGEDMSNVYDRERINLNEEQLQVNKQPVQVGEVGLHKDIVTEEKSLDVPVTHEEVTLERHPVSHTTDDTTPIGQSEEIRVPVTEEQVNVTKTPVITGEASLEKRALQTTQQVSDTTKREELRVEQTGDAPIHGTPSDRFHYKRQQRDQASKPRARSRKRR